MTWLRGMRADVAIALVFVAGGLVEAALLDSNGESRALTAVLGVLLFGWLALRRRAPVVAASGFSAVLVLQGVVGDNFLFDQSNAPFVAILFLLYSLGRHLDSRRLWAPAGVIAASAVAVALSEQGLRPQELVFFFTLLLPWFAGRAMRGRALLQHELREKAEREEAERHDRSRRAIEAERDRIASELQAVVANGLSAMVVQAEAVPRLLDAGRPERAGEALAVIEDTGRDALVEMRRLLGVLRRDGDRPALAPQPGVARLEALVERQRELGLEIDFRVEGDARELPSGVDLTAYRVVEDALEAALEKGARRAWVLVRYRDAELQLQVRDDRVGGPSDRMPGLRDRVDLYGGSLSAGRENGDAFRLRARMPLEGAVR